MECFLLIVKLFGGLIFLFVFGKLIGYIFKLDDYLKYASGKHPKKVA
jgi:hypothetical protein